MKKVLNLLHCRAHSTGSRETVYGTFLDFPGIVCTFSVVSSSGVGSCAAFLNKVWQKCGPLTHILCSTGARAMGLVLGTGIGGLLATPAVNFPGVFSPTGLFARCSVAIYSNQYSGRYRTVQGKLVRITLIVKPE